MAKRFNRTARNGPFDGAAGDSVIGKAFVNALKADFARHGVSGIRKLRRKQPYDYLRLVASLLPQVSDATTAAPPPRTDDQFARELEILGAFAAEYNKAHPER